MTDITNTNASLAAQMSNVLDGGRLRENAVIDIFTTPANGGAYGNGTISITTTTGATYFGPSWPTITNGVTGPAAQATNAAVFAQNIANVANATLTIITSLGATGNAAALAASNSANAAANSATNSAVSATNSQHTSDAANTSANAAAVSATNSQHTSDTANTSANTATLQATISTGNATIAVAQAAVAVLNAGYALANATVANTAAGNATLHASISTGNAVISTANAVIAVAAAANALVSATTAQTSSNNSNTSANTATVQAGIATAQAVAAAGSATSALQSLTNASAAANTVQTLWNSANVALTEVLSNATSVFTANTLVLAANSYVLAANTNVNNVYALTLTIQNTVLATNTFVAAANTNVNNQVTAMNALVLAGQASSNNANTAAANASIYGLLFTGMFTGDVVGNVVIGATSGAIGSTVASGNDGTTASGSNSYYVFVKGTFVANSLVSDIQIDVQSISPSPFLARPVIYADDAGGTVPGTLIASGPSYSFTSTGVLDMPFSNSVLLANAATYWFGYQANQMPNNKVSSASGTRRYATSNSTHTYTSGAETPFPSGGSTSGSASSPFAIAANFSVANPSLGNISLTLTNSAVVTRTLGFTPLNKAGDTMTGTLTANAPVVINNTVTFADGTAFNTAQSLGPRNKIINGDMRIDQRNAGANSTTTGYTVDRWAYYGSQVSKITWGQNLNAVTPPPGFTSYLGVQSSSAYTVNSTDYFFLTQAVEGLNLSDLGWGTSSAKPASLSFWAYSSLTGTFGGALKSGASTRTYPFSYSIPAANTWTYITVSVAPDTTPTWSTDNTIGVALLFSLGMATTYSGTAGSWQSAVLDSVTGAVSVVGTSGAKFYMTGVQLEIGTQATPFEHRQYGQEFAMCQRYFQGNSGSYLIGGYNASGGPAWGNITYPVQMRASPSITFAGSPGYSNSSGLTAWGGSDAAHLVPQITITSTGFGYCQLGYSASAEL